MVEIYLSRQEIRRLVRAVIGDSTDESVSSQQTIQVNALIDRASLETALHCRWQSIQRRATLGIDAGQRVIPYADIETAYWLEQRHGNLYLPRTYGTVADPFVAPDLNGGTRQYVGPGNITALAICGHEEDNAWRNNHHYQRLRLFRIPVEHDLDRFDKAAQERFLLDRANGMSLAQIRAAEADRALHEQPIRGRPCFGWPTMDGINLWPYWTERHIPGHPPGVPLKIEGKRYIVRVDYTITPSWEYHKQVATGIPYQTIDCIPSVVDADAIQHHVLSNMYAQQGDMVQSERYMKTDATGMKGTGFYWTRIYQLRAAENTGQPIPIDSSSLYGRDCDIGHMLPNWKLGPDSHSDAIFNGSY